jgi:hypothetical protein
MELSRVMPSSAASPLSFLAPVFTGTARVLPDLIPATLAQSSLAPSLATNFVGLRDPGTVIPPDTMGAIGPSHFLSVLNSGVGVFNRTTGIKISEITLGGFWASLGPVFPFDPKVLYDQYSGRFVIVTLDDNSPPNSRLLLAVSATSDPTGVWNRWAIASNQDNTSNWADFPGLGIDNNNVYITANMFDGSDSYQYSKVWVIPKGQLLSGSGTITRTEFSNTSGSGFTMQPAHAYGYTSTQYLLHEGYYISGPPIRQFIRIASISSPAGSPVWTDLGFVEVAGYPIAGLPKAPQLGSANLIETNDARLLNARLHNGMLWATHTVADNTNTRTEVAWYQIDPSTAAPTSPFSMPLQQGRISDSSRFYYYPSIAVNYNGDVGIGFSGSSATEYAGAYYTARAVSDPAGTMQAVATLKSGEAPYYKIFYGTENRWGDFSATCVDPNDDLTFWTVQEYAATPENTWGTWVGSFALSPPSAPAAPTGLSATSASDSAIDLTWADQSSNERTFGIERKTGASGTYAPIATVIANTTTYGDSGLSEGTTYYYRVKATNIGGDSAFSNESSALTYLAAPAGLSATASSSSQVDLGWTNQSVTDTRILIERKTGASGTYTQIDNVSASSTAYGDNTVTAATTYYYRLKATNPSAGSLYSNEANATTPGDSPTSSGGGGGGCSVTTRQEEAGNLSALVTVSLLLSPLGILALFRKSHFRHPICCFWGKISGGGA